MKIFGIPIYLDLSTEIVEKQARYLELCKLTDVDAPMEGEFEQLYDERLELFHTLLDQDGLPFSTEELEAARSASTETEEEETSSRGGLLGWLFG